MNQILTTFSLFILSINVDNVATELKLSGVALSGLDVLTSLNDPIALFQSLSDFVSLIFSNGDTSQQDLSDIRNTLSDINNKLDDISEEIQGFREEVMNKLKELNIDLLLTSRLDEFFKLGEKLDFYYDRFKEVYDTKYSRALRNFIKSVRSLTEGVRAILTKMHNTLSNDRWTSSAFRQLTDNTFVSSLVCSRGRSQQLIILNLYEALCAAEIKGLTMDLFAIKAQMKNKEEMAWEINNLQVAFTERSKHAVSAAKKAMSKASLEFWNCTLSDPQEGKL
uniref:Uncharacterized protein n=1 Tax=Trichogramma kaykai TaxID=54128 RepID=A0ABD2WJQ0_9HYME